MLLTVLLLLCCACYAKKNPVVPACYGVDTNMQAGGRRTAWSGIYLRLTMKLAIGASDTEYHWFWFWRNCFHGS